jgi:thiamine-phosphate pyrophosphorylase
VPRPAFRLLLITDRKLARRPLPELVGAAVSAAPPGWVAIQLREKDLDTIAQVELARALLPICRARAAPLLVNERIDLALTLGLDGVHLPQASLKADVARQLLGQDQIIGVSCHSVEEVREAQRRGADCATFGPLFDTPSKREFGPPLGLGKLVEATELGLPLYGLGGITALTAPAVRESGAFGVAAIGAWLQSTEEAVSVAVRALLGA